MHTNWCVLIEISMEIGMLNFWLGLLVTALMEENYFTQPFWEICHLLTRLNSPARLFGRLEYFKFKCRISNSFFSSSVCQDARHGDYFPHFGTGWQRYYLEHGRGYLPHWKGHGKVQKEPHPKGGRLQRVHLLHGRQHRYICTYLHTLILYSKVSIIILKSF